MNIIDILTQDYQRFPVSQTYDIYADNVYFKDPLNEFCGIKRYQEMISFISKWFQGVKMNVHAIEQTGNIINTRWTLHWTTPLPWQPRIAISGRSELTIDQNNLIVSHIDYWDCSRWDVVRQHLPFRSS
jgi:hypothetical protein